MDNPQEQKLKMFERLFKLEGRIKYLVLEADLNCDCVRCLRLKDQINKFLAEVEEAYPFIKSEGAPPRPPIPCVRLKYNHLERPDDLNNRPELPEFETEVRNQ
jgi:hypothetical protein